MIATFMPARALVRRPRAPILAALARSGAWLLGLLLLCATGRAFAEGTLEAVDVGTLPGNRVQLRFQLSAPVTPTHFSVTEPARIVVDFPETRSGMQSRRQDIGSGVAERVSILEGSGRTRAMINLSRMVPYSVKAEGNTVLVTLEATTASATAAPEPAPSAGSAAPTRAAAAAAGGARVLNRVDFRRGGDGQGLIIVNLSDPSTSVDVREEGDRIVAEFANARLGPGQQRRLDVSDFGTPVFGIDAVNRGRNAQLSIRTNGRYEMVGYQSEGAYTIEVRPAQQAKAGQTVGETREKAYRGQLLSLNFQDIEVRAVLQIIADFTGLNVVVSDTVTGRITLRLKNVPWDQALDIIAQTKGLTQRQTGNVIYIAPTAEVAERERLELEARKQSLGLAPLRSELIQVNYAKAAELAKLINGNSVEGQQRNTGNDNTNTSMLSDRGVLSVDERTNTLLIQDVAERVADVRALVSKVDIPVRQVMIDSRIVIANDDFSKELGVRFGGALGIGGPQSGAVVGGNADGNAARLADDGAIVGNGSALSLAERLGVNLPVASPAGSLAFAILGRNYLIDLELSAMQAEGRGEVLSNPRVLTADRMKASIMQGREIPYTTAGSANNPPTVSFKDALLELTVVPQITPDRNVIMDLKVTKNEDSGQRVLGQPVLDKREVITQVLVRNGETVVLGGVFEQITRENVSKVPFLGDLPMIGRLFRNNQNQNQKLELLIFVTPQIVDGNVVVR
ncbi:type IV pilus assembly protein PilQ [Plasticicumulans lactativorans]|uniref:Type IV pilus assembly protein PilQ n=1 Tax=Plasticicumulans lactativorans TaxID=1133106 RepID=A0A4R2LA26_9GAMM|nr:type IV pilus secretin PilQ [Plasticicumulans lactativorans]TCO81139.1 type IV pilus assembly protein PilQ [Plasticicumulans lactativorans]